MQKKRKDDPDEAAKYDEIYNKSPRSKTYFYLISLIDWVFHKHITVYFSLISGLRVEVITEQAPKLGRATIAISEI